MTNNAEDTAKVGKITLKQVEEIAKLKFEDLNAYDLGQAVKIIEGTVANIPPQGGRKHPQQEYIQINTKDILFICGGAFDGLDKIIEARTGRRRIGFTQEEIAAGVPEAPVSEFCPSRSHVTVAACQARRVRQ